MLDGKVTDPDAQAYGKPAIQLHCTQAADSVRGASGAPVVIDNQIVGVLNLQLLGHDGVRDKPYCSTLYAVSLKVLDEWGGELAAAIATMRTIAVAPKALGRRRLDTSVLRKEMATAFDKQDL